ncbi:hypothetical protein [Halalkalicoccus jeotgali]|nr:hypothetical protein [Halalkalicoccus jeotgali]
MERDDGTPLSGQISAYWTGLDRGWQAVILGVAVVGLHWMGQAI